MHGCAADIAHPSSATPILATPRRNILPTHLAVTCSFLHGLHPPTRRFPSRHPLRSAFLSLHPPAAPRIQSTSALFFFGKRLHHTARHRQAKKLGSYRIIERFIRHVLAFSTVSGLSTSIDHASQDWHLFCCDCRSSKVAQIASIRARLHSCAPLGRRADASVAAHRSQLLFLCSSSLCCPLRLCPHRRTHSSRLLASSPPPLSI